MKNGWRISCRARPSPSASAAKSDPRSPWFASRGTAAAAKWAHQMVKKWWFQRRKWRLKWYKLQFHPQKWGLDMAATVNHWDFTMKEWGLMSCGQLTMQVRVKTWFKTWIVDFCCNTKCPSIVVHACSCLFWGRLFTLSLSRHGAHGLDQAAAGRQALLGRFCGRMVWGLHTFPLCSACGEWWWCPVDGRAAKSVPHSERRFFAFCAWFPSIGAQLQSMLHHVAFWMCNVFVMGFL